MQLYRPFSVLPILSKVFENHICKSFYNHFKSNDMLHKLQFGFRKSHSTEMALIRLVDQLFFDLDENKVLPGSFP